MGCSHLWLSTVANVVATAADLVFPRPVPACGLQAFGGVTSLLWCLNRKAARTSLVTNGIYGNGGAGMCSESHQPIQDSGKSICLLDC
ncbi:hypothetical protein F5141DRAFT_1129452 [Pisolithus sp. B1]|nr:hypothetical protein F5141DRAFT_1129452 [Pisolithus sp. B1]